MQHNINHSDMVRTLCKNGDIIAAEMDVKEYIGPANDPNDPKVVEWHRAFR